MYRAGVRTPNTPRRRTALAAAAVSLPLALGACSSSSTADGPPTTRAAGHPGSGSVCAVVTPAQIEQTLGRSVGRPGVANSTGATACTYPASSGNRADSVIITFRSRVTPAQAGAEQAALQKEHGTLTPVTVSNGQAFTFASGSGKDRVTSLVTLVGETQVVITSTAALDRIENLSQEVFTAFATGATTTTSPSTTATTAPG